MFCECVRHAHVCTYLGYLSLPLPNIYCAGRFQIVVSGPAGFVFHVEGILADLRVPPEVVVLLD